MDCNSPLCPLAFSVGTSSPLVDDLLLRVRHNSAPLAAVCSAGPRPVSKNRLAKLFRNNLRRERHRGQLGPFGAVKVPENGPRFGVLGSLFGGL